MGGRQALDFSYCGLGVSLGLLIVWSVPVQNSLVATGHSAGFCDCELFYFCGVFRKFSTQPRIFGALGSLG